MFLGSWDCALPVPLGFRSATASRPWETFPALSAEFQPCTRKQDESTALLRFWWGTCRPPTKDVYQNL